MFKKKKKKKKSFLLSIIEIRVVRDVLSCVFGVFVLWSQLGLWTFFYSQKVEKALPFYAWTLF